jgi:arginase
MIEMYGGKQVTNTIDPSTTVDEHPPTLRLVWPQWQGASVEAVRELFSEVPFEEARRGYAVGAAVLNAVLPAHTGPIALVPVESGDRGLSTQDGIEAKEAVLAQRLAGVPTSGCESIHSTARSSP